MFLRVKSKWNMAKCLTKHVTNFICEMSNECKYMKRHKRQSCETSVEPISCRHTHCVGITFFCWLYIWENLAFCNFFIKSCNLRFHLFNSLVSIPYKDQISIKFKTGISYISVLPRFLAPNTTMPTWWVSLLSNRRYTYWWRLTLEVETDDSPLSQIC